MKKAPRYITAEEVENNSNVADLYQRLKQAYLDSMDSIEVPQRISIIRENPFTAFDIMPAYSEKDKLFITKIGAVFPKADSNQLSVNTTLVTFSAKTGEILAIFDGDAITKLKCAAITALVTDYCAPDEAKIMGLIGTGVQAHQQIKGVLAVRNIEKIRIYSRNQSRVQNFIEESKKIHKNIDFIICTTADEITNGAQIISTATTSFEPILTSEALNQDAIHINCIGNHIVESREIPLEVLMNSQLIVEDRQTAILEAGKVHEKAMTIEELVKSTPANLQKQRTVFSSTGHAFLDLITVSYLVDQLGVN
jgi:ornithine cyclodeaminase/alanine dehydrogenase-like protein (mu-crystallin family)